MRALVFVLLTSCQDCTAPRTAQGMTVYAPLTSREPQTPIDLSPILPLPSPFKGPGPWGW